MKTILLKLSPYCVSFEETVPLHCIQGVLVKYLHTLSEIQSSEKLQVVFSSTVPSNSPNLPLGDINIIESKYLVVKVLCSKITINNQTVHYLLY